MMQYCVRSRSRKMAKTNSNKYILECVHRYWSSSVNGRNRNEMKTQEKHRKSGMGRARAKTHRNKIYEYQEKLWSACFCNEQHESKLIIEFIIVFSLPNLARLHFMFRFFPVLCLQLRLHHKWLLALTVFGSFFLWQINFTCFHSVDAAAAVTEFSAKEIRINWVTNYERLSSFISNCTFAPNPVYTQYV